MKTGWKWLVIGLIGVAATGWAAPDAYERDNTSGSAKLITNGQTQRRNIHAAGNRDWAKFYVATSAARNVVIETAGTRGDTRLWLYQAEAVGRNLGRLIATDDDSGSGRFSRIRVAELPPSIYYIRVEEKGNDGTIGAYTLHARWRYGDDYERDNVSASAKPLRNSQRQEHSIHVPGDTDWVHFTVGGLGASSVQVETRGGEGDTQLWLYRANSAGTGAGRLLAYDDDGGEGSFSRLLWGPVTPGKYYARVQEYNNDGTIPSYTLWAHWGTLRADAYEPDTYVGAPAIANGETQQRSIHEVGDRDYVKFYYPGGARSLVIETAGTSGDTYVTLYSSGYMSWLNDDDSGEGKFSKIVDSGTMWAGTWYIEVEEKGNDETIPAYTLRVDWTPP